MKSDSYTIWISVDDAIRYHEWIIERFGGASGTKDIGLLESAINHPQMTAHYGRPEERTMFRLAAAYFYHIIKNHPFVDGNKRTAVLTTMEFLGRNGIRVSMDFDALYQLAIDTASSKIDEIEIASVLQRK